VIRILTCHIYLVAGAVSRKKRSLPEFGDMIRALTGRSPMDFNGYGHFCGLGGKGIPVDPIDMYVYNRIIYLNPVLIDFSKSIYRQCSVK